MGGAGGIQGHHRQVHALERGLLVREVATGADRLADAGVDGLDRVGTRYEIRRRPAWCSAGPAIVVGHTV
jgi:hypothetical protein